MAKRKLAIGMYPTYRFRDQDPILDEVKDAVKAEAKARGISEQAMAREACNLSRVSRTTVSNWYSKKTKRARSDTMNGFLHAMDHKIGVMRIGRNR